MIPRKEYDSPRAEILLFRAEDVINTSPDPRNPIDLPDQPINV